MDIPPQSVISKIRLCGSKNLLIVQPVEGQLATGVPKAEVSIAFAFDEIDDGTPERCVAIEDRGGNRIKKRTYREEPYRDPTLRKLSDKHTSTLTCKSSSVARCAWIRHDTTLV
jgi:hypothetical protein